MNTQFTEERAKTELVPGTIFSLSNDCYFVDSLTIFYRLTPKMRFKVEKIDTQQSPPLLYFQQVDTSISVPYYSELSMLCSVGWTLCPLEKIPPKNNDGRDTCYFCKAPTKQILLLTSYVQICTKCGK